MALLWKYWSAEVGKDHSAKKSLQHLTEQLAVRPNAKVSLKVSESKNSVYILLDEVAYFYANAKGLHQLRSSFYKVNLPCYELYKEVTDEQLVSGLTQWSTELVSKIEVVKKTNGKIVDRKQIEFRMSGGFIYICKGPDMLFRVNGKRGCETLQNKYILRMKSDINTVMKSCIIL